MLREKDGQLKRFHQGVKDNLQLVSSLLNLQAQSIQDPQTVLALQDCQDRIRCVALAYERLDHSPYLTKIDVAEYIYSLLGHLFRVHGGPACAIILNIQVRDVLLEIVEAVPLGLIVNELVSTALKNPSTPDRNEPTNGGREVQVELHLAGNNRLELSISDDGLCLPPELDLQDSAFSGMHLAVNLTRVLGGTLELRGRTSAPTGGTGATFKMIFPCDSP